MPDTQHCRWCGAGFDERAAFLAGRVRCGVCGVTTTHPWPSSEGLDAAYAGWYRPQGGRFAGPGDALLRRARASLAGRVDRLAPAGPVLDVGSGDGTLVRALERQGRRADGIERGDRELAEHPGPYAAVVFWHSLEHLPDARGALAHAARALAPGGLLVVAVPNARSLQARLFGDRWFGLDLPRHLFHLDPVALTRRCEELGLRVTGVSHVRGGQVLFGWLHGLVDRVLGADLYDAIRRPEARRTPLTPARRAAALALGTLLAPVAAVATAVEVATRRAGTFALEAVRV